ncbi:beta-lactamase/transpeptidase-like protein [Microdochium trichocladiopsis]|uniref:Beta-lactamase/transpeptidase-like protein n=1 Tax=Microdochium trichocladiopsis TaxID=1682393 RepID=A0A9P8YDZ3_9PEZI|nr:beta-lactamase/transpeptidase-like protein [Microdochium trichocladiopsis]KAH7037578.1 beta-lactamase/transpeptidase-like protein [Microdochium trichocladiopsis]
MRPFEKTIEAACAAEEIPGAVLLATDRHGKFTYGKAFGKRSVREGADQSPLKPDAVMWIASCTKVVTCIAAMQCCERGLLSLDGPIYDILPELKDLPVIRGFNDDGSPKLVPHKNTMTLRHLLTHSSGFAYDETHPKLLAWHAWHRTKPSFTGNSVEAQHGYPLVFEPGESWCYGAGIDWAGVAVERACGGTTLQKYFEDNIFNRVGARDIVFSSHMHTRPDLQARMADMSKRDPENPSKVKRSNAKLQFNARGGCFGGSGMFASPTDYLKVLKGMLTSDTDETLLKKESVAEFFRPCLSSKAKAELNKLLRIKEVRDGMGNIPESVSKDWSLGGIINEGDVPGGRLAGTMTWGGLPNLVWWCDRKAGLCALYAGQLLPPADARMAELCGLFEEGLYKMREAAAAKL